MSIINVLVTEPVNRVAEALLQSVQNPQVKKLRMETLMPTLLGTAAFMRDGVCFKMIQINGRWSLFNDGVKINQAGYAVVVKSTGGHTTGVHEDGYWTMPESKLKIENWSEELVLEWINTYNVRELETKFCLSWKDMPKDEKRRYVQLRKFSEVEAVFFFKDSTMYKEYCQMVELLDVCESPATAKVMDIALDLATKMVVTHCNDVVNNFFKKE